MTTLASVSVIAPSGSPSASELDDAASGAEGEWLLFADARLTDAQGRVGAFSTETVDSGCGVCLCDAPAMPGDVPPILVRADVYSSAGGLCPNLDPAAAKLDLCLRISLLGWDVDRKPGLLEPGPRRRRSLSQGFHAGMSARLLGRRQVDAATLSALEAGGQARVRGSLPARFASAVGRIFARNGSRATADQPNGGPRLVVWTDAYPARSETFIYNEISALHDLGWQVRIESLARPARLEQSVSRRHRINYLEDESPFDSACALVALAARHPIRCLADLRSRARWVKEEEVWALRSLALAARRLKRSGESHVHVHFLAGAALSAMRVCSIAGVPYSAIGHGYDVFEKPRNLPEKLTRASFAAAPCDYTARQMAAQTPALRGRVEVIVMGVDPMRFRRSKPYPGGRTVVAVGRLVEKKGFRYLIEAAGTLQTSSPLERVIIIGDGPLESELQARVSALGLDDTVRFVDAWGSGAVAGLLEQADLLAMPAVIAGNGDRDAMPVVVKEAMAMEVPVVASDEVGLPELILPAWGRLVPPADAKALAQGIDEILSLPEPQRRGMGVAGRRHVLEHCSTDGEARRLAALIED